jgi:hypothetical protein
VEWAWHWSGWEIDKVGGPPVLGDSPECVFFLFTEACL